jgi:hypothetical protein
MIKVHYDTDQESLVQSLGGRMCFFAENINEFRKQASSSVFSAADLDALRPPPGYWLCHNIIVGGQEAYGQNRNGDGWPKHACIAKHGTFVTHGAAYREHRNRDKKEAIGQIKAAKWHPDLERIETVKWYDKKKTEKEYEMAKAGKNLSFSMSARVPNDRCSCCDHRAKRASDYCSHLRDSMNQWLPEFQKYAFAINDDPTFYDDSAVDNPADRNAHYLEYAFGNDDLKKAASVGRVITGEEWAHYEGVVIPDPIDPVTFPILKLAMLTKLADEEKWLDGAQDGDKRAFVNSISPRLNTQDISDTDLEIIRGLRMGTLFREMAKRAAILPFVSFAAYCQGIPVEEARDSQVTKTAASKYLPRVFTDMLAAGDNPDLGNMYEAASDFMSSIDTSKDYQADAVLQKLGSAFSIDPHIVQRRVMSDFDRETNCPALGDLTKCASTVDSHAQILAEAYGHYQLRALCDMEDIGGHDITPAQQVLITAANRSIYR